MKLISVEMMSIVGNVDVLAVSDDVVVPGAAQHGDTLFGRAALADEVEHGLGAVAAGEVQDLLHLGAVGDDHLVGADLAGELDGGRDCGRRRRR